jgi:hypothetical protein
MARKITGGLVGSSTLLGSIQISPDSALATAADQNITLSPGGTGNIVATANIQLNAQNDLRFADSDSSNYVAFQAPATVASNVTWTLPAADGSANQVLSTNASGTLSWATAGVALTNNTIDASTNYVTFTSATSDVTISAIRRSSTGMTFQPSTGTLTVTAFVESSSIAFKENVSPITGALDAIMQLVGVTYDRKDGSSKNEAGLIKEEVEKILPNLVKDDGIHYTKLTAYLIESIKSLKEEINELKSNK